MNAINLVKEKRTEPNIKPACKYCGSINVSGFGKYKDAQRYWCKDCRRKFKDDDNGFYSRVPKDAITNALSMRGNGVSIESICMALYEEYGFCPSKSTVFRWIKSATKNERNQLPLYQ